MLRMSGVVFAAYALTPNLSQREREPGITRLQLVRNNSIIRPNFRSAFVHSSGDIL